jgi:hypothetical protein
MLWDLEGNGQSRHYPSICQDSLRKTTKIIRTEGVPAENSTEHLWNTS